MIDSIPEIVLKRLRENWGVRAESLNCFAEIKFMDGTSGWCWYLLALDPDDDDTIKCIVDEGDGPEIMNWTLGELETFYDSHGESPKIDREYRRMKADLLYSKLMGKA